MKRETIKNNIIEPLEYYDLKTTKELIHTTNVFINGRVNKNILYTKFIEKRNLYPLYNSIFFHTTFLKKDFPLSFRIRIIVNNITSLPKCKSCENLLENPFNSFCSFKCNRLYNDPLKHLSNEEKENRSKKMVETRRNNGTYIVSSETRKKQSKSAKKTIPQKRKTNLKRYGVPNPGVLGAYSSKAAEKYILKFLKNNNISHERCFFKYGNEKEFFQMIFDDQLNKYKYFSYDLVVFKTKEDKQTKNLENIDLILEYNGPWHYKKDEVDDLQAPCTPYPNSVSIYESIKSDELKLNHMYQYCKNILIFWEKSKILENYFPSPNENT